MGVCIYCGASSPLISETIGICFTCLRNGFDDMLDHIREVHRKSREPFDLPAFPPRDPKGIACTFCANACLFKAYFIKNTLEIDYIKARILQTLERHKTPFKKIRSLDIHLWFASMLIFCTLCFQAIYPYWFENDQTTKTFSLSMIP